MKKGRAPDGKIILFSNGVVSHKTFINPSRLFVSLNRRRALH
jgi:hypothetical protein